MDEQALTLGLAPMIETFVSSIRNALKDTLGICLPGWVCAILAMLFAYIGSVVYSYAKNKDIGSAILYSIAIGGSASILNVVKKVSAKKESEPTINSFEQLPF